MVRISGSATRFLRGLSLLWVLGSPAFAGTAFSQPRRSVTVSASDAELEPVAGRLSAELASAGYSVNLQFARPIGSCERAPQGSTAGAWVRLEIEPTKDDEVVASICLDGTAVRVEGLKSDPARLAVNTAEAINGLEATAPSFKLPVMATRPVARRETSAALSVPARPRRAIILAETLLVDPTGFPHSWGTSLDVELGLGPHTALVLDAFFPIARAELSTRNAELRAGFSFLRVGPALRYSLGDLALSGSVVVGPGFTWVTAEAVSPYVGGKDWAFGIWGAVGIQMIYLERSPVFAVAMARGALLLPNPRFSVPDEARRDFGPFLIEASLGIGLRL
jgi:hypothetical protein